MAEPTGGSSFGDETTETNPIPSGGAAEAVAEAPTDTNELSPDTEYPPYPTPTNQTGDLVAEAEPDDTSAEPSAIPISEQPTTIMAAPASQAHNWLDEKGGVFPAPKPPTGDLVAETEPNNANTEPSTDYDERLGAAKSMVGSEAKLVSSLLNLPSTDNLNDLKNSAELIDEHNFLVGGSKVDGRFDVKLLPETDFIAIVSKNNTADILHAGVPQKNPRTGRWEIIEKYGSQAMSTDLEDFHYGEGTTPFGAQPVDYDIQYYKTKK